MRDRAARRGNVRFVREASNACLADDFKIDDGVSNTSIRRRRTRAGASSRAACHPAPPAPVLSSRSGARGELSACGGPSADGNRYLDPAHGRFASRDPLGLWGDPLNLGNGYTYAASNPWSLVDPMGLEACEVGGNISANSSFWDILWFLSSKSSDEELISNSVDWNRFDGAGSDELRENAHEGAVLSARQRNNELAKELARSGIEIAATESGTRFVVGGVAGIIRSANDAGFTKGIKKWASGIFDARRRKKAFEAAKKNNWIKPDGSTWWPDNEGFSGQPHAVEILPGSVIDRYGIPTGRFVSPAGTPYRQRALPPGSDRAPPTA